MPELIENITSICCGLCNEEETVVDYISNADGTPGFKDTREELRQNISDSIDFTFPIMASPKDKKYPGGFAFVPVVETTIREYVNYDYNFQDSNESYITGTVIGIMLIAMSLAYIAGVIMWLLVRKMSPSSSLSS